MVNLEKFMGDEFEAEVTGVSEVPLKVHIGTRWENFKAAMRKPDSRASASWSAEDFERFKDERGARKVLVVGYEIFGTVRDEWLTIPMGSGYEKSNLKKVMDKNPGLGADTREWPGKTVLVSLDKNGYYELAK